MMYLLMFASWTLVGLIAAEAGFRYGFKSSTLRWMFIIQYFSKQNPTLGQLLMEEEERSRSDDKLEIKYRDYLASLKK